LLVLAVCVSTATAKEPLVLDLWPSQPPGETGKIGEEKLTKEKIGKIVTNVSKPTLTVYRPAKDKDTGATLIIAPGGAFRALAIEHEGENVAEWCNSIGVTGVVLKYRVPRRKDNPQAALQDGQRAISLVRSKAKEWGVDPERIGMIGFSAGGGVTGFAMLNADKRSYKEVDDVDKVSCKLNYAVIIYSALTLASGDLKGPEPTVPKDAPPTFLAVAHDDFLVEGTVKSYLALKKAGVPAELHVYAAGGHGFGLRVSNPPPANDWTNRLEAWLRHQKLLGFAGSKGGDEREVAGIKLCWCPAGKFIMGSPQKEPERRPGEDQVEVTLTRGFWMAKYEATQGQWKRVVGKLPGELTAELPEGDDYPVGNVNFAEAEAFCQKLTELGRKSGELPKEWEFRLPTEAQWEYACRAGTTTATAFGDKLSNKQANFKGKPYNGGEPGPSPGMATKVGSYPANAWGLHDMHGNTYEWCRDWYHAKLPGGVDPDLYAAKPTAQKNRTGDVSRVRRGGAWCDDGWPCRSAFRLRFEPERRYDHIGFRVVAVQP
jgi:formylglycine-generating enzyme required for sulfatase activity/acetyl esterase/lipase